eukprot:6778-Heterococcus_DN1.PRE.1
MPVSIEEENELYQTTDDDNTNSSSGAAATAAAAAAATPSHLRADNGTPTSSGAKRGRDDTGINGAHGTISVSKRARVVGFFSSAVKAVGSSAMKAGRRVLFGEPSTSNVPATDASTKRKRSDDKSITTDSVNNSNDTVEQRSPKAAKLNDSSPVVVVVYPLKGIVIGVDQIGGIGSGAVMQEEAVFSRNITS